MNQFIDQNGIKLVNYTYSDQGETIYYNWDSIYSVRIYMGYCEWHKNIENNIILHRVGGPAINDRIGIYRWEEWWVDGKQVYPYYICG